MVSQPPANTAADALQRLQALIAEAASLLQLEQQQQALALQSGAGFDQGQVHERQRVTALISCRIDLLGDASAGARELRLLRQAILAAEQA